MFSSLILLLTTTILYAGYNLLVKVSGSHVPEAATSPMLATICLQLAALSASLCFTLFLVVQGVHVLKLSMPTYAWALVAGLCIGGAEICYF